MRIGEYVKKRRTKLGWTMAKLSDESELSVGHISDIENGHRVNLGMETMTKLAKGLGVNVDDIITATKD